GVDLVSADSQAEVDALNAGLFPEEAGEVHTFVVEDLGAGGNSRQVTMTSANVTATPVQNTKWLDTPVGRVGYLLFSDHIATAEEGLMGAVDELAAASIDDLVLHVRYNGGGFLAIAGQLAYMIAGDAATAGKVFELVQFNDKHPATNPITN